MASTVNLAFEEFMKNTVRLDSDQANKAKASRENLISNVMGFDGDDDFFELADKTQHLKFGSFARKTKIRPLDDIDQMICMSAEGKRTYFYYNGTYYIYGCDADKTNGLMTEGTNHLNSTKIINRFIKKLRSLNDYRMAEMHKNQEAATLQLKSYPWNFDIVPCWHMDIDKYLIPDGLGNWKKTDPRIDNQRTTRLNQKHKGNLLDVIRIMKYWNKHSSTYTIGSYLLECMILDVYEEKVEQDNYWIDIEFRDILNSFSERILYSVNDPKGIQGDLNNFTFEERTKISNALSVAYNKADEAVQLELTYKDQKAAINKWKELLGSDFPDYS